MATTSLGIPLVDFDTDQPNGAGQINAVATSANDLIAARLLPAAHHRGGHPTMTGLSAGSNPVTGGWTLIASIGDISYASGTYTVARSGAYVWAATCGIGMTGASTVYIDALVNGAQLTNFDGQVQFTGPGIFITTPGSPISLNAGDTVQLQVFVTAPSGVTVNPQTFSLYKVA